MSERKEQEEKGKKEDQVDWLGNHWRINIRQVTSYDVGSVTSSIVDKRGG